MWMLNLDFPVRSHDPLGIKFEDKVGLGKPTENPYVDHEKNCRLEIPRSA